ncbi:MAG TPA: amino acid ABC transporter permease [Xylella taiwanensis]
MTDVINVLSFLLQGISNTLIVTFTCFVSALFTGLTVAVIRRLNFPIVTPLLDVSVYLFQCIPILILVFLVYFGLSSTGMSLSPLSAMNISVALVSGSYLAEVFRGALGLIERTEIEVAETAGLSHFQRIRSIELPQMFRFAIPGILNEFSSILKASPFAYTVGITEMTKQAMTLTAVTMNGLAVYSIAGILYFIIYKFSASVAGMLENKMHISGNELNEIRVKTHGINKIE